MADRDVKVTYKSRVLPRDYDDLDSNRRPRIPTALDPYSYPYEAGALSRVRSARDRGSTTTIDSDGSLTAIDQGRSTIVRSSRNLPDHTDRRSSRQGREALDTEVRRGRDRPNDFVLDNTVRKENNTYVMDARGEVEIVMPGPDRDQDRAPRYTYTYASPTQRHQYETSLRYRADDDDDRAAPEVVMLRRDITPPRHSRRNPPTSDDDWRLVDRMSTTRISTNALDPSSDLPRRRGLTQSSEDSYILVSPSSPAPSHPQPNLTRRSSMRRTSYSPTTLSRRRSRSISFRDTQVINHDCSERRHERPGAEAALCGTYLRHYTSDDDWDGGGGRSRSHPRHGDRDTERETKTVTTRYYRDDQREEQPYPPQRGKPRRQRSRSRRGGRDRFDDDARDDDSYVSERRTYTKKTTYR